MFNKSSVVIILIFIFRQMFLVNSRTLPTKAFENNNDDSQLNNPTSSYYKQNVFGPNTYAFGFEVTDKVSGNIQFRDERRYANGTTQGSFGYVQPDGRVMVTHFLAGDELGYLSQSRILEPGEELSWRTNWPTRKPNESIENSDEKEKVNLTSVLLPVEPIKEEHGIDLNPPALEKELINPAVLEIINGEAPLISDTKRKNGSIGFATINKFIPPEFPIVPFELPSKDLKTNLNEGLSETPIPVLNKTITDNTHTVNSTNSLSMSDKGLNLKKNSTKISSAKQASQKSGINEINSNKFPRAESIKINKNSDWYDQVINQTRQEYLKTVR